MIIFTTQITLKIYIYTMSKEAKQNQLNLYQSRIDLHYKSSQRKKTLSITEVAGFKIHGIMVACNNLFSPRMYLCFVNNFQKNAIEHETYALTKELFDNFS